MVTLRSRLITGFLTPPWTLDFQFRKAKANPKLKSSISFPDVPVGRRQLGICVVLHQIWARGNASMRRHGLGCLWTCHEDWVSMLSPCSLHWPLWLYVAHCLIKVQSRPCSWQDIKTQRHRFQVQVCFLFLGPGSVACATFGSSSEEMHQSLFKAWDFHLSRSLVPSEHWFLLHLPGCQLSSPGSRHWAGG